MNKAETERLCCDLETTVNPEDEHDTAQTARLLVETLAHFCLPVEVTGIETGLAVTRYELRPASGVRVERIAQMANTLQMVLMASYIRIQAPVPGKNVVSVELANRKTGTVTLRELMQGEAWGTNTSALPLALGKDVAGRDIIFDLAEAPHMLMSGNVGSGKSVCLNTM